MVNQIYIPTAPASEDQNRIAIELQAPLTRRGYAPGLMLVILGGRKGLQQRNEQYADLQKFQSVIKDWPLLTMLSCIPLPELDLLNETEFAVAHIKEGVNYAAQLPFDTQKTITFHLGSLVTEEEFRSKSQESWRNEFHRIIQPRLKDIATYGKEHGVTVKVETTPVPEFGDIPDTDQRNYRGVRLNQLRNPFYLTHQWGFEQIKDSPLSLCLDICHNRTIYEAVQRDEYEGILFPEDIAVFAGSKLLDDVTKLDSGDLVHLNDGRGLYSQKAGTVFEEGVTLGEGDIRDLDKIIRILDGKHVPYVLEINETDFKNRPNTKKSIDYLLQRGVQK